ncbi:hypothetical protein [Actinokineospora globicatena]|uniref:hypothetical protein n=1 Tax=Actinokineospora globicatena TaxID=103729 RepID=UPI0020A32B6B|nr:hypothetical protein [Actinokineospora globicatena]MCP2303119.1 hypothetical protein [Actinokineospora globicatena]GLW79767.1 hypothetical protein Aglo01_42480 [Actinokineospora globicatena]GLW85823.1 hypothetical protein Aglo02_34630 [Actinokineospora globicatena]
MLGATTEAVTYAAQSGAPVELDIWVDQQNHLTHYEARAKFGGTATIIKTTFREWAAPATITAPDPNEVMLIR